MKICKEWQTCHYKISCQFAKPTTVRLHPASECANLMTDYSKILRELRKEKIQKLIK